MQTVEVPRSEGAQGQRVNTKKVNDYAWIVHALNVCRLERYAVGSRIVLNEWLRKSVFVLLSTLIRWPYAPSYS